MMETITLNLSRKNKRNFFIIGFFSLVSSIFGFFFRISGYYTLLFTGLVLIMSLFWTYTFLFYFCSIKKTSLQVSDEGLKFTYPFGNKVAIWGSSNI
jgi:hypothetical protein